MDGFPVRTMFSYDDSGIEISPFLLLDYEPVGIMLFGANFGEALIKLRVQTGGLVTDFGGDTPTVSPTTAHRILRGRNFLKNLA